MHLFWTICLVTLTFKCCFCFHLFAKKIINTVTGVFSYNLYVCNKSSDIRNKCLNLFFDFFYKGLTYCSKLINGWNHTIQLRIDYSFWHAVYFEEFLWRGRKDFDFLNVTEKNVWASDNMIQEEQFGITCPEIRSIYMQNCFIISALQHGHSENPL